MQALFFVLGIIMSLSGYPKEPKQILFNWQLAVAISTGTDSEDEQRVLARIAWYESNNRESVASCRNKGDNGKSHGTFQIQPRTDEEKKQACGTLNQQVALSLKFIRRSLELCAHLEVRDRLSLYTTGKCQNNKEARVRWGL